MNINRELDGLNKRITRLKFKENPPILRMVTLQPWEVEDEADVIVWPALSSIICA